MKYNIYKDYDIFYDEDKNTWLSASFEENSYKELIKKIDEEEKREKNIKLNKFYAFEGGYGNLQKKEITSAVLEKNYRGENTINFWCKKENGSREKSRDDFYKIDDEIISLLKQKDEISNKISEWKEKNIYSDLDILQKLGYPEDYIKKHFKIEINEAQNERN